MSQEKKPQSLAAKLAQSAANKATDPNAELLSVEEGKLGAEEPMKLEKAGLDNEARDAFALGHTVSGATPTVEHTAQDVNPQATAINTAMQNAGILTPEGQPNPKAMTTSFPHNPQDPAPAKPMSNKPYAGDPPAVPLDIAGIVAQGDAVQPVTSNNNTDQMDIKYVPGYAEAPKGSYLALRLHSWIRKNGAKVVPTNGYYRVDDPETAEMMKYYADQNLGLVQLID